MQTSPISWTFTEKMSASTSLFDVVAARRSFYTLSNATTISDSRIEEVVKFAVKHAPSSYNVQSARAVILFKTEHSQLWDIVKKHMEVALASMDTGVQKHVMDRITGYNGSYGTVLWFEDQASLELLKEKNPMAAPMLTGCTSMQRYEYLFNTNLTLLHF